MKGHSFCLLGAAVLFAAFSGVTAIDNKATGGRALPSSSSFDEQEDLLLFDDTASTLYGGNEEGYEPSIAPKKVIEDNDNADEEDDDASTEKEFRAEDEIDGHLFLRNIEMQARHTLKTLHHTGPQGFEDRTGQEKRENEEIATEIFRDFVREPLEKGMASIVADRKALVVSLGNYLSEAKDAGEFHERLMLLPNSLYRGFEVDGADGALPNYHNPKRTMTGEFGVKLNLTKAPQHPVSLAMAEDLYRMARNGVAGKEYAEPQPNGNRGAEYLYMFRKPRSDRYNAIMTALMAIVKEEAKKMPEDANMEAFCPEFTTSITDQDDKRTSFLQIDGATQNYPELHFDVAYDCGDLELPSTPLKMEIKREAERRKQEEEEQKRWEQENLKRALASKKKSRWGH